MRAGKLNTVIVIQQPSKVYASGVQVETWTTLVQCWANLKPVVSNEFEKSNVKFQAETHYEVRIRHNPDVKPEHRFTNGGDTYHIFGVIHTDEAKRETVLYAKKAI